MAKRKQTKAQLPEPGDTSVEAVARRLKVIREEWQLTVVKMAKAAECTPAELRAWESGQSTILKRNAWFIAIRSRDFLVNKTRRVCPSEWIYTGCFTEHTIPAPLPKLGDDLSGFAARVREAIANHGITLADIAKAGDWPASTNQATRN